MTSKNSFKQETRTRVFAALVAAAIIVASFVVFLFATQERIVDQNKQYLEGTTLQTARRVGDLLENAQHMIGVVANTYERTMTTGDLDPSDLASMFNMTPFDRILFASSDGAVYDDRGIIEGVNGREIFAACFESQESGKISIEDPQFGKNKLIAFYTPLFYGSDMVGVLAGAYTDNNISEMITTYFYGQQTSTYLLDSDGYIIADSSTVPTDFDNIENVFADARLNDITLDQLKDDLAAGRNVGFSFGTPSGEATAYLMRIPDNDWTIMRSFPGSITNALVSNATNAAIVLVLAIIAALVLFAAVLLVQARKQSKQLLMEKQQATRIVDASTNLFRRLVLLDLKNGTYEYLKATGLTGYLPHEGKLSDFESFWDSRAVDEEDHKIFRAMLDRSNIDKHLTPEVPYLQEEYRIHSVGAGEKPIWVQTSMLCIERDKDDLPTSVLLTEQDVTEIKKQELESREALAEAYNAADQASKAKSDFLNSMSHDIRTPMNSIMGLTAIASMHIDDKSRVEDCLQKISISSRHLLGLINEVLDMAKIESGKINLVDEDFDLPETIESLLTIMNPQIIAKNQELKVDISNIQHEHVVGDPMRLQQVFVNIMGNSIKFTPEGGTISLHICEKPSGIHGSGCYEFTFSDTGCGMSKDFVERVFEPFARANDSRVTKVEGTGLGMSIVKSIVSLMNGTIDVESEEGVGSTFRVTVYLKIRDDETEDLSDLQGLSVLVADDDIDACEHATMMLSEMGMKSKYVMDGESAVAAVREAHDKGQDFTAVILDWKMGGKSGIEAAAEIRDIVSDEVPIIILSAYDWSTIEQEARKTGVDAFISKPLFKSRLIRVLRDLLCDCIEEAVEKEYDLKALSFDGKHILLTEDNVIAAEIAKEIIGDTGASVDHAENGKIAVDMLLEHDPDYYDLVFMDVQMPVMNGYEATRAIRKAAADRPDLASIPIIALTADAFTEDIQQARSAGMNAHLSKPIEIGTLIKTLQEWL